MPETILAIETALEQCAVSLFHAGGLTTVREEEPGQHSRRLVCMVDQLLKAAGVSHESIDLLAWSAGPGSFTGLRIAASFCQALSWAHATPVLGIPTLELLALAWLQEQGTTVTDGSRVAVALDARMGDLYLGTFYVQGHALHRQGADRLVPADASLAGYLRQEWDAGTWVLLGEGWNLPGLAQMEGLRQVRPLAMAGALVTLAQGASPDTWDREPARIAPVYLRGSEHWKKHEPVRQVVG